MKVPKILVRVPTAEKLWAYLPDLSEGGIFVRADKMLPLDSEVDIELIPPGADAPVSLHGRVSRHQNDDAAREKGAVGMGIRFENLSPESEAKIAALIAEYPRGKTRNDTDAERVRTQLQGVVMELGHVREELQSRERELAAAREQLEEAQTQATDARAQQALLTTRVSYLEQELHTRPLSLGVPATDGEGTLRREAAELQIRLSEALAKVEASQREISQLEEDEAQSRALSERLAADKAKLEKVRREEQMRAAVEMERLRGEAETASKVLAPQLEETKARLDNAEHELQTERARSAELEAALNQEREARAQELARLEASEQSVAQLQQSLADAQRAADDFRSAQAELDLTNARAAASERQLADVKAQLERVKGKERDLRRLLAAISSRPADEEPVTDPQAAVTPESAAMESAAMESVPEPQSWGSAVAESAGASPQTVAEEPASAPAPIPLNLSPRAPDADVVMFELEAEGGSAQATPLVPMEALVLPQSVEIQFTPAPPRGATLPSPLASLDAAVVETTRPLFGLTPAFAAPPPPPAESMDLPSDDLDLSDLESIPGPSAAQAEAIQQAPIPLVASVEVSAEPFEIGPTPPGMTPKPNARVGAFANMDDLPIPAAAGTRESAGPSPRKIAEFDEFKRRLTSGDKLLRTERFSMFTATEPAEVLVTTWLERADTMDQLCSLADGRLGPNRIARVVFELYNRSLIDFRR